MEHKAILAQDLSIALPVDAGPARFNSAMLAHHRHVRTGSAQRLLYQTLFLIAIVSMVGPPELFADTSSAEQLDQLERKPYIGIGAGVSRLRPNTSDAPGVSLDDGDDTGVQLTLGVDLNDYTSVELHGADLGSAEFTDGGSIDYREFGLSGLFYLGGNRDRFNRRGFTLFGRAGIGHIDSDPSAGVDIDPIEGFHFTLGTGVEFSTRSGFGLRAEAIAFDEDIYYGQLGLLYRLGRLPQWPAATAAAGVSSQLSRAELMSGKFDRVPKPTDTDGDGITRNDDLCPRTRAGVAVSDNGCAVLSGVVDGLTFVSGSAELTDSAERALDSVAESLLQQPETQVRIAAHTDDVGPAEINMRLSQLRARSVARYLVGKGVDKTRLTARAYGEIQPVDTNDTEAGRSNNRRVEISLTGK